MGFALRCLSFDEFTGEWGSLWLNGPNCWKFIFVLVVFECLEKYLVRTLMIMFLSFCGRRV